MREISLLARSKETDRKLRWATDANDGTSFELYIPKDEVPTPWPGRIWVDVWWDDDAPTEGERKTIRDPIWQRVRYDRPHTQTARYRPVGDDVQIGDPYIPYVLLPDPPPTELLMRVRWDFGVPWRSM